VLVLGVHTNGTDFTSGSDLYSLVKIIDKKLPEENTRCVVLVKLLIGIEGKVKVNVKLSLCLTKHHAMKA